MYNNMQSELLDREQSYSSNVEYGESSRNATTSSNLEKILNYEKYRNNDKIVNLSAVPTLEPKTIKKSYSSPELKFESIASAGIKENLREENKIYNEEDITPSSTTMQFGLKENSDIYEEIHAKSKKNEDKEYFINTKGKVLIAVYALVVATIFSLILLNSRMLKTLDNSIEEYSGKVTSLNQEYTELSQELDYIRSDEVIISKAEEMGMTKG